ncbi:MAG: glycoside hydrolase family 88 protein [Rhodocyclaceae bacterium]
MAGISKAELERKLAALHDGVTAIREDDALLRASGAYGSDMSIELWDWAQGVGLYGIWRLYRATGDAHYLDYLEGWYARHRHEAAVKNVNHVAPMLTLASLWEMRGGDEDRDLIEDYSAWIASDLLRTEMGGYAHTTATRNNEEQLWVNTLFMSGLFQAKAGALLGRPSYCDDVLYQFLLHAHFLIDRESGLWRHGWHFGERHHFSRALWARGNGWAAITAVELIDLLPPSVGAAALRFAREAFQRHCTALLKVQAGNGMWHTLLDEPTSYQETSGTAAIAYAFLKGVRLGLLPPPFEAAGARAIRAVLDRVDTAGDVAEVSSGTPVFNTLQEYRDVPIKQRSYGQSLAMLALSECLLHPALHGARPHQKSLTQ